MRPLFAVLEPGALATVQDLGRFGHQRHGVGPSGAMDGFALGVANILAGNARGTAGLELAFGGLVLEALADGIAAVCGADLGAELDGQPVRLWSSFAFRRGQKLVWRGPRKGAWAYLSMAGGVEVPEALGSRSTSLRAGLGGLEGRALRRGDVISAGGRAAKSAAAAGRGLSADMVPQYGGRQAVRAVDGPQAAAFAPESLEAFFSADYRLTPQSDRMGYRLEGPALRNLGAADVLSDALVTGAVQVPAGGQPIVLMADRQTAGGYAVIAAVASVDLPLVAQLRPGETVSFRRIGLDEAQQLAAEREDVLRKLECACLG